jgi:hypothetical protein
MDDVPHGVKFSELQNFSVILAENIPANELSCFNGLAP